MPPTLFTIPHSKRLMQKQLPQQLIRKRIIPKDGQPLIGPYIPYVKHIVCSPSATNFFADTLLIFGPAGVMLKRCRTPQKLRTLVRLGLHPRPSQLFRSVDHPTARSWFAAQRSSRRLLGGVEPQKWVGVESLARR